MHPTGIEPALKASEAFVLSIRLRVHAVINVTILLQRLHHTIPFFICPVRSLIVSDFCRIFFCLYHLTEPDPEGNYPFPGISLPKCSNRILTTKSFACLFPFGFRLSVPIRFPPACSGANLSLPVPVRFVLPLPVFPTFFQNSIPDQKAHSRMPPELR